MWVRPPPASPSHLEMRSYPSLASRDLTFNQTEFTPIAGSNPAGRTSLKVFTMNPYQPRFLPE